MSWYFIVTVIRVFVLFNCHALSLSLHFPNSKLRPWAPCLDKQPFGCVATFRIPQKKLSDGRMVGYCICRQSPYDVLFAYISSIYIYINIKSLIFHFFLRFEQKLHGFGPYKLYMIIHIISHDTNPPIFPYLSCLKKSCLDWHCRKSLFPAVWPSPWSNTSRL